MAVAAAWAGWVAWAGWISSFHPARHAKRAGRRARPFYFDLFVARQVGPECQPSRFAHGWIDRSARLSTLGVLARALFVGASFGLMYERSRSTPTAGIGRMRRSYWTVVICGALTLTIATGLRQTFGLFLKIGRASCRERV